MRPMRPIQLNEDQLREVDAQLGVQVVQKGQALSADPKKYPVWGAQVDKKVLIYVPNHTIQDENGVDRLRMDTPLIHPLTVGNTYPRIRCISGINIPDSGLTGECPLCTAAANEPWELANMIIKSKCKQSGLDESDTDNKEVKAIRSQAFSDRAVKSAERRYTFPIVVFETSDQDAKVLVKDENGNLKCKTYWYDCSENVWNEKWMKTLGDLEDEPTHPGGRFFVLNYKYTTKGNAQPNVRDAARNMTIGHRKLNNSDDLKKFLDNATKDWTPAVARQVLYANMLHTTDELQEVADEALEKTRQMIETYKAVDISGGLPVSGFKLENKAASPAPADDGADVSLDTDLDYE